MARGKRPSDVLKLGDLILDQAKQEVTVCGDTHHLTPKECRLLATFMQHPGEILTKKFLMREVWETDYIDDTRTIQVHISWLRSKLALSPGEGIEGDPGTPWRILTVRGVGYVFSKRRPEACPGPGVPPEASAEAFIEGPVGGDERLWCLK